MHRSWIYLINPFLTATLRNYKKAVELSTYTDAALLARIADPFFAPIYAAYHALHLALVTQYNDWVSQGGMQKGSTATLDQLLFQLGFGKPELTITSKISDWDLMVQTTGPTFRKGTPAYIAIFPHGHLPFQNGDKDERINAVQSLGLTLADYPVLAPIKALVDAFYLLLTTARTAQEGEISDTGTDSSEVREAVTAAMIGLFVVYGACVQHYAAVPQAIAPLFNLELLRTLPQMEWNRTIEKATTENIFKRTLPLNRKIKITNHSGVPIKFFVASEKNDITATNFIVVAPLEDETIEWGTITNGPDSTFFNGRNEDPNTDAPFTAEILPEGE